MGKKLSGHRALITGASSGIGEQYAMQLARMGADLVIAARRLDRLDALAEKLSAEHGVKVETLKSDLGCAGAAQKLFEEATAGGKPVTILVNNAGSGPFSPCIEAALDKHVSTIQLNATSLTELCHLGVSHMLKHGKPSYVVNVGSIASFQGVPNFAVYSATKAYVRVFSEILKRELKGTSIGVTCLCPGGTLTEFSDANGQVVKESAHSLMMTAEEVVRQGIDGMLKGRAFVVPGLVNKIACLAPKLMPSGLALTIAQLAMDRSATPAAKVLENRSK